MAILVCTVACGDDNTQQYKYGDFAYETLQKFFDDYPIRQAGTDTEKAAGEYISQVFTTLGYIPTTMTFTYNDTKSSQNIIAVKQASTENAKDIVVGAHYDSVSKGKGTDDNASGVAVMLDCAKFMADKTTNYNIIFIAFGAEEVGLKGSNTYVNSLTDDQIQNIELMVNLDTLAAGDYMYAYGGADDKSQNILSNILTYSDNNGLNIITQQGNNPDYPKGTTGDWSDHKPFKAKNVPFIYFESTNWNIGDLDGSSQVELPYGEYEIMHTMLDNLDFIEKFFPGRIKTHMQNYTKALINIVQGKVFTA